MRGEVQHTRKTGKYAGSIPEGLSSWRFLPGMPGKKPTKIFYQHRETVPGIGDVVFECPRANFKAHCPVCAAASAKARSGDPGQADVAKRMAPKPRFIANALNISLDEEGTPVWEARGEDNWVQVFEAPAGLLDDIVRVIQEEQRINFTDPLRGCGVNISREGKGRQTTYTPSPDVHSYGKPFHPDQHYMAQVLATMHDLDTEVRFWSAEDIERKLRGETVRTPSGGKGANTLGAPAAPAARALPRPRPAQQQVDEEQGYGADDDIPF